MARPQGGVLPSDLAAFDSSARAACSTPPDVERRPLRASVRRWREGGHRLAEGVLMERDGVSQHDAYIALRRFSRRVRRPLVEPAEDVVASTRSSQPTPSSNATNGLGVGPVIAEPTWADERAS